MASFALAPTVATRRGKELLVPRSASLPPVCMKCGTPANTPWRRKFYWHSPWLYIMILFPGLLIYVIVALIVRKQMELNLPICETHHADRKRYKLLGAIMLIGFIPVSVILGIYGSEALGWITCLVMFVAGIVFYQMSMLGLHATKIDDLGGSFRGACDTFLNQLPEQT
jgi:hypothetical protein